VLARRDAGGLAGDAVALAAHPPCVGWNWVSDQPTPCRDRARDLQVADSIGREPQALKAMKDDSERKP
jgi:hypothetical protein